MTNATIAPASVKHAVAIEIEGLNKWYGDFHALKNIDLSVRRGEKIVICGPSGSGKSTMIRCINALEDHQSGRIVVDGTELTADLKKIDEIRRDVGMVFQHFNLFPHLTILENCTLAPIWVRKMARKEAEAVAMHYLVRVKIPEQANKYPGQLSGGQQQRVAIARAVVTEPRLVLMDEPLSNLDAKLRLEMRTEIRRLHQSLGLTTLYVTHDQEEALSMADRLVVLREGRVQQVGTPQELHNGPVNWHVADFMGYRNLIDLEVTAVNGTAVTVADQGFTLRATAAQPVTVGDRVRVAIRPEDLVAVSDVVPVIGGNSTTAAVSVVEYHGREFAIGVTTPTGRSLYVRSDHAPVVGSAIELTADPARVLVFQADLIDPSTLSVEERELAEVRR
jgi:putative spermidine/putrescine transport system ATP-binding protein